MDPLMFEVLLIDWLGKPLWMWLAFVGIVPLDPAQTAQDS